MKKTKWLMLAAAVIFPFSSGYAQAPVAEVPSASAPAPVTVSPGAAEVVRLAEAGTSDEVILAYIQNSQVPFNLSADQILYLKDVGLSSPVVSSMLNRDNALQKQPQQYSYEQRLYPPTSPPAAAPAPEPAAPAPVPAAAPAVATAPAPVVAPVYVSSPPPEVSYFYNDLSPYGTWVSLPGYGWCWQPRVVVINRSWQPYCDGGHWLYSDAGWYWASDYSWGWAPFHYGRWFMHAGCGWVWLPDRVWGPSWVTWRTAGDHCGWAPLPPHADFDVHLGWRFNGVRVGLNFDFGLRSDHFTFIALRDFHERDFGHRRLRPTEVTRIYNNTTIINNYVVNNKTVVNQGIKVERVTAATHREFRKATIRDLPAGSASVSRMQVSGKNEAVVYRPQLRAPAKPVKMVAQKVDERNPVVRHTESAPLPAARKSLPARGVAAPAAVSRAAQSEVPKATPRSISQRPASSRPDNSAVNSRQPAAAAPSAAPGIRSADEPKTATRSSAVSEPAPTTAASRTARRTVEEAKPATRAMPGYRPAVSAPAYPLRTAEPKQLELGPSASRAQSSPSYLPKTYHQAAEVRALPSLKSRPDSPASSSGKSSGSDSRKSRF